MLKKAPGRAGLNHMSDAVKISGTHERTRRWARQKDKLSCSRWHLGGNYALLMADDGALPCESEPHQGGPQMRSAHKYAVGNS